MNTASAASRRSALGRVMNFSQRRRTGDPARFAAGLTESSAGEPKILRASPQD
jgi:hypothetical protein